MFKYYFKIFYKRNFPHSFNFSILFPLIGTTISTLSVVVIFSVMTSLESKIKNTIISTEGSATIRIKEPNKKTIHGELSEIQKYLTSIGIASQKIIDRPSIISYDNKAIFVNVIGLQDLNFLEQAFDLSIDSSKFEEGVLIGSKLNAKLGFPSPETSLLLTSPLDSGLSISGKVLKVIDENFFFDNPASVKDFSGLYVYISYKNAKEIFPLSNPYIVINRELSKTDLFNIKNNVKNGNVKSWEKENPLFFSAIKLEKFLYTTFGFMILLIVSFNIFGLVNLIILRKKNQLSSLLYFGASKKQLESIFIVNILLLGFIGSIIGGFISIIILKSNILIHYSLIPSMIKKIDVYFPIIIMSVIFNIFILFLSTKISVKNNIKNIGVLKSNAIEA